jgi:hypothetical protein
MTSVLMPSDADMIKFFEKKHLSSPGRRIGELNTDERERIVSLMWGDKIISGQTFDSRLEEFFNACPAWKSPAEHEKIHLFWEKYPDYPYLKCYDFKKTLGCVQFMLGSCYNTISQLSLQEKIVKMKTLA